eukprot:TRINITY_DN4086_c0_g1_i1.p1 TRINITY_DN4086_c0_g1~~TRINITY_DN4086_c0_g1_i1.p1  ORF type:complete len:396 (-),score=39.26 TRINITY_DN4086_c0_g1_i1:9-1073(-)
MKQIDHVRLFKSAAIMALVLFVGWMIVGMQSGKVEPVQPKPFIRIRTWRWSPNNFGDALGPVILKGILRRSCNCTVYLSLSNYAPRLMTIGSIFEDVKPGDVVWGSGIKQPRKMSEINPVKVLSPKSYKILYLRGPQSFLAFRTICDPLSYNTFPEIYGDPALLFGCLFPKYRQNRTNGPTLSGPLPEYLLNLTNASNSSGPLPLFVSHMSLKHRYGSLKSVDGVPHISAFNPWESVVEAIASSSFVISNSLHGIIIAESLGIPARFVDQGLRRDARFKFHDYYEGTGRKLEGVASTLTDALLMGGVTQKPVFNALNVTKLLIDAIPDLVHRGIVKMSPGCSCVVPTDLCSERI